MDGWLGRARGYKRRNALSWVGFQSASALMRGMGVRRPDMFCPVREERHRSVKELAVES